MAFSAATAAACAAFFSAIFLLSSSSSFLCCSSNCLFCLSNNSFCCLICSSCMFSRSIMASPLLLVAAGASGVTGVVGIDTESGPGPPPAAASFLAFWAAFFLLFFKAFSSASFLIRSCSSTAFLAASSAAFLLLSSSCLALKYSNFCCFWRSFLSLFFSLAEPVPSIKSMISSTSFLAIASWLLGAGTGCLTCCVGMVVAACLLMVTVLGGC